MKNLESTQVMEIVDAIFQSADSYSFSNGEWYYSRGLVKNITSNKDSIQAEVEGNEIYHVTLYNEGWECTCLSYRSPCKHVVAMAFKLLHEPPKVLASPEVHPWHKRLFFCIKPDEPDYAYLCTFKQSGIMVPLTNIDQIIYVLPHFVYTFHHIIEVFKQNQRTYLSLQEALTIRSYHESSYPDTIRFITPKEEEIVILPAKTGEFCFKEENPREPFSFRKCFQLGGTYTDPITGEQKTALLMEDSPYLGAVYSLKAKSLQPFVLPMELLPPESRIPKARLISYVIPWLLRPQRSFFPKFVFKYLITHIAKNGVVVAQFVPKKYKDKNMSIEIRFTYGYTIRKKTLRDLLKKQWEYLHSASREGVPLSADPIQKKQKHQKIFDRFTTDLYIADHKRSEYFYWHNKIFELQSHHVLLVRDSLKEKRWLQQIRQKIVFNKATNSTTIRPSRLKSIIPRYIYPLMQMGVLIQLDPKLNTLLNMYKIQLEIRPGQINNWFEAKFRIQGFTDEEIKMALEAYYANKEYIRLKNEKVILLANTGIDAFFRKLKLYGSKLTQDNYLEGLSVADVLAMELEGDTEIIYHKKLQSLQKKIVSLKTAKRESVSLPKTFKAKLRPYQKAGLNFLYHLYKNGFGGVLADDMGLGKTVQVLALISYLKQQDPQKNFLVVAPLAALNVWKQEIEKFCPFLRICLWHGPQRTKQDMNTADIVLTSYGTLLVDKSKTLDKVQWDSIFLDEAQIIKNPHTKIYNKMEKLKTRYFFALSGTPLENYPQDLWSIFNLVVPGLLGDLKRFRVYFDTIPTDESNRILAKRVAPFLLRRSKNEVLQDLPPKTESYWLVDMPPEQAHVYEALRKKAAKELDIAMGNPLAVLLKYLTRLRLVACHPEFGNPYAPLEHSGKLMFLKEQMPQILRISQGVLIFSQFTKILDLVGRLLDELQIPYFRLDGSTSLNKRKELTKRFQEGEKKVFLISLRAGGNALTLHRADTVIHLDPWWNPAVENQATDRAHRIGQDRPVFVYKMISKGTLEEKVLELQEKKRKLFEQILEHKGTRSTKITAKDLAFILDTRL